MTKTWRPYLLIFLLTVLLYGQTIFFGFSRLDDSVIQEKKEVLGSFRNLGTVFSSDVFLAAHQVYYRPLLNVTYMFDATIGGQSPWVYHFDNILLHFLAVCLLYLFLKKILRRAPLALFLSLLFLTHPILTQAVAWLPGRNDSLLTVLVLAAALSFINFSRRPDWLSLSSYFIFFLLAILTKETAIFLPLLLMIYWVTIGRDQKVSRSDQILIVLTSATAGVIWFLMRQFALAGGDSSALALLRNLPAGLTMGIKVIGQIIFPFHLAVVPFSADTSLWFSLIALPFLIFLLYRSRQRRLSYLIFGAAWFFVFFIPPLLFSNGISYFEHRLYLPLIGFFIILGEIDFIKNLDWHRKRVICGTTLIIFVLAILVLIHSRNFRDPFVFWQAAVKSSPHCLPAHVILGGLYSEAARWPEAEQEFLRAIALSPQEPIIHYNLGVAYLNEGRLVDAQEKFQAELAVNPGYYKALANLGDLAYKSGRTSEAVQYWRAALVSNPNDEQSAQRLKSLSGSLP